MSPHSAHCSGSGLWATLQRDTSASRIAPKPAKGQKERAEASLLCGRSSHSLWQPNEGFGSIRPGILAVPTPTPRAGSRSSIQSERSAAHPGGDVLWSGTPRAKPNGKPRPGLCSGVCCGSCGSRARVPPVGTAAPPASELVRCSAPRPQAEITHFPLLSPYCARRSSLAEGEW